MHLSFLPYVCNPATQEVLTAEIQRADGKFVLEGALRSASSRYPIVRGIPRFAGYDAGSKTWTFTRSNPATGASPRITAKCPAENDAVSRSLCPLKFFIVAN